MRRCEQLDTDVMPDSRAVGGAVRMLAVTDDPMRTSLQRAADTSASPRQHPFDDRRREFDGRGLS